MQLVPRYLVKNRIDIVVDLAGFVTEFRPVYKRQIQVYRGIDNLIEFRLLNADQKPVDSQLYTPRFMAYDANKNLVIDKTGTVLDNGSTATRGLFTVNITENDILNLEDQFLSYTIFLVDANNDQILTYTDTHFGTDSTIRLSSDAFPAAKDSKEVSTHFAVEGDAYISSAVYADPGINNNEALHTAAIYSSGYIGTIEVEATLENQVTGTTDWATIATVTFDGTETAPKPVNFTGVFSYIRFRSNTNPNGNIQKILVRN